jgi:hypothetical protein
MPLFTYVPGYPTRVATMDAVTPQTTIHSAETRIED